MTPLSRTKQAQSDADAKVLRFPSLRIAQLRGSEAAGVTEYGQRGQLKRELLRAVDVAVAATVLVAVFAATNSDRLVTGFDDFLLVNITLKNLALLTAFTLLWPMIFAAFGLYENVGRVKWKYEAVLILGACSLGGLATLPFLLTSGGAFQLRAVVVFWIGVVSATLLTRVLLRVRVAGPRSVAARHVLIVGSGPRALRLYQQLLSYPDGNHQIVGFVDSTSGLLEVLGQRPLGTLEELENILMHRVVDQVLIALPIKSCYAEIQNTINVCERVGVEARYLADVFEHSLAKPRYDQSSAVPLVALKVAPDDIRLAIKRGIDITGAGLGLVLLGPLFVAIGAAIKLTSPGPIVFAQKRYGYNKRLFKMYKFRTMVVDAEVLQGSLEHLNEAQGPVFKIKDDPRLTRVGRFLRRTSLDELPQLLNVLRGEMSLVGPRPLPTRDVHNFSEAWLMRRFSVLPGCTCLWQISGRSNLGFDDWMTLDLRYIDQWSLLLDLEILLRTVPAVVRGAGAS